MVILGTTANGKEVCVDYKKTNINYHLLETPNLIELVKEALPNIVLEDLDQTVLEYDMGRVVGTTNLVETTQDDEILYAKRRDRDKYSRFVKNKELTPCSSLVIVIRKQDESYFLWTAMCGRMLPPDAYVEDSLFNRTHALVYDETLIQKHTATSSKPRDEEV